MRSKVCFSCFKVPVKVPGLEKCPSCNSERLITVDDLMVPAVIALNSKGWHTKICCESHLPLFITHESPKGDAHKGYGAYIHFVPEIQKLPYPPPGWEIVRLGNSKYKDDNTQPKHILRLQETGIDAKTTYKSLYNRMNVMFSNLLELTQWAERLEERHE